MAKYKFNDDNLAIFIVFADGMKTRDYFEYIKGLSFAAAKATGNRKKSLNKEIAINQYIMSENFVGMTGDSSKWLSSDSKTKVLVTKKGNNHVIKWIKRSGLSSKTISTVVKYLRELSSLPSVFDRWEEIDRFLHSGVN